MQVTSLLSKIEETIKYFDNSSYSAAVEELKAAYEKEDLSKCTVLLHSFPTRQMLLLELLEKLKGKPIYDTLKEIDSGKIPDGSISQLKGLFSLGTHISIEIEQGQRHYAILLPKLMESINHLIYLL